MAKSNPLHDPDTRNWYTAVYGLKCLKIGLQEFVNSEVKTCYNDTISAICKQYKWSSGTHLDTAPYSIDIKRVSSGTYSCDKCSKTKPKDCAPGCANAICLAMKIQLLQNIHRFKTISWENIDSTKRTFNEWDIAKCCISTPGYDKTSCAEDTDLAGLLNVIINMKSIAANLSLTIDGKTDIFSKV